MPQSADSTASWSELLLYAGHRACPTCYNRRDTLGRCRLVRIRGTLDPALVERFTAWRVALFATRGDLPYRAAGITSWPIEPCPCWTPDPKP